MDTIGKAITFAIIVTVAVISVRAQLDHHGFIKAVAFLTFAITQSLLALINFRGKSEQEDDIYS